MTSTADKNQFTWDDPFLLNEQLTEEERSDFCGTVWMGTELRMAC